MEEVDLDINELVRLLRDKIGQLELDNAILATKINSMTNDRKGDSRPAEVNYETPSQANNGAPVTQAVMD